MGVESDQLVFDYLSRIGDLAQTALPAAQRMRLVAQLRTDIDRERGTADSPAAVRRILDRLGPPDAVVEAAAEKVAGSRAGEPSGAPDEPPTGYYGPYAKPARAPVRQPAQPSVPRPGPARPDAKGGTDWWRVGPAGDPIRPGDELIGLPGMTGGVTIPLGDEELADDGPHAVVRKRLVPAPAEAPAAEVVEEAPQAAPAGRRRLRLPGFGRGWGSPVLLVAAALLVAGAVLGTLIPMGLGWLLGYLSRRLTRPQAKFGILGIPGAAALGTLVWLWGRDAGKWGTPIAQGHLGPAIQDALPATIRIAAVGSALYLLWRARRTA
jgi:hypothetical protein